MTEYIRGISHRGPIERRRIRRIPSVKVVIMRKLLYNYEISIVIRVCHGFEQLIMGVRHWLGLLRCYCCSDHGTLYFGFSWWN